jgi:acyl-CoA thioesterase FadM
MNAVSSVVIRLRRSDASVRDEIRRPVYLEIAETARILWLKRLLGREHANRELMIRELRIVYRAPLHSADAEVVCSFAVQRADEHTVTIEERLATRDGRIAAELTTELCGWDLGHDAPQRLRDSDRLAFASAAGRLGM